MLVIVMTIPIVPLQYLCYCSVSKRPYDSYLAMDITEPGASVNVLDQMLKRIRRPKGIVIIQR